MDYLLETIKLAEENVQKGGRPFATIIVKNNKIIATGLNLVAQTKDPTAHAEIEAIRKASQILNSESLSDCTLYTTSEPCPMCLGALYWAELDAIHFAIEGKELKKYYYAERKYHKPETFMAEFCKPYIERKLPLHFKHKPEVINLLELWKSSNKK